MLELSLPISLTGHCVEGTTWAGITPQSGQSLWILNHHHLTRNPFISRLRNLSSPLSFLAATHRWLLCVFSNIKAQLVSHTAGAPWFHRNNPSTWKIQPLVITATQAASEESRRNPVAEAVTEKSVTKRLFQRNIHPPQTFGGWCLHPDTAFYICALSDWIPRSSSLQSDGFAT